MRFSAIDLELSINGAAEPIVRNHPADRSLDQQFGMTRPTRAHILGLVSADVTRKAHEAFLFFFFARHTDLVGVDDDYEVARIDMWSENRFVFATQKSGRL